MKRVAAAVALSGILMVPGVAAAGASTDAALGLGAFAVFNQILSGTGVFGAGRTVVVERPVVVAPPPPVVYAPPPRPVVVYPAPPATVVYRAPRAVYAPAPVYVVPGHGHGHGKHWKKHHRHH
jgi:hypothetical protein